MTSSMEAMMDEPENEASNGRRILWVMLAGLGMVTTGGFIAGFLSQHRDSGGGAFSTIAMAILAVAVAVIIALAYAIWRNLKAMKSDGDDLTARERLNRNLLVACTVLGGVMGAGLVFAESDDGAGGMAMLGNSPLPAGVALAFAFVWAVVVPGIAYYWHRHAVDEQERHAYREGAYYAFYAYGVGAPLWWMLWRGGLVPAPDGVVIYYITIGICGVVWLWKKYR